MSKFNKIGGRMTPREESKKIFNHSCRVFPGGVNSPVRSFPGLNMTPLVAIKGKGGVVWDADGHSYIDYCCSWGALILGHSHPAVVDAVADQIHRGSSFGMVTPYELQLAVKICDHIPSMQKIRFVSSGTEATMSAIRCARGFTGKDVVIKFDGHYHGHSDGLLVGAGSGVSFINDKTSSPKGVPLGFVQNTLSIPFNDEETFRKVVSSRDDIAAVILEPVAANMGVVPAEEGFLFMVREETAKRGIVLIFDEVISGFRIGLGGAQEYYGVVPDMTCLGKIVGGGLPAAAFGGRSAIMDCLAPLGDVYQAGTLSGNPLAMQAGLATLQQLEVEGFYERLEKKTEVIVDALVKMMFDQGIVGCINHVGSMFTPFFGVKEVKQKKPVDQDLYRHFFMELIKKGIYIAPSPYEANFVSSEHTLDQIQYTQATLLNLLSISDADLMSTKGSCNSGKNFLKSSI
jgi:glutamate-1-semialdehyde 2,1-aminomutase